MTCLQNLLAWGLGLFLSASQIGIAQQADLILHHGKVVTVDSGFSIAKALAVKAGRIIAVGTDEAVLQWKSPDTTLIDLQGRTLVPGLIDSHVHPVAAAMTEFDHEIPAMESIADVLKYIATRAGLIPEGEWITLRQVFITRLREQRYPTRRELDRAAPRHPVLFATGPDASLNTLALERSGIDRDFKPNDGGAGFAEKDPATGELTGLLRNCTRFVKVKDYGKPATDNDRLRRLEQLLKDYTSVGFTSVCDRDASLVEIAIYRRLREQGKLPLRVSISQSISSLGPLGEITDRIRAVARDPLHLETDPWLRIIGVKMYLDGGMLTGSAYMREPWGVSTMYGITDPAYRGVRFIAPERLLPMVRAAIESGLQFTAHSVGDGAVHALLDAYEEVHREHPLRPSSACITHSNFMSREAIDRAARIGVVVDMQPAWLYLDARTLLAQFGDARLRYFQPLKSLFAAGVTVGGGSDHMQKIGSLRATNPYHPFLAIQTAVTRKARWHEGRVHPEEALSRAEALRFYTINNARLLSREKDLGSLEVGKSADFALLDTDLLECPEDRIRETRCLKTFIQGRLVFDSSPP